VCPYRSSRRFGTAERTSLTEPCVERLLRKLAGADPACHWHAIGPGCSYQRSYATAIHMITKPLAYHAAVRRLSGGRWRFSSMEVLLLLLASRYFVAMRQVTRNQSVCSSCKTTSTTSFPLNLHGQIEFRIISSVVEVTTLRSPGTGRPLHVALVLLPTTVCSLDLLPSQRLLRYPVCLRAANIRHRVCRR
jgi:hypothetical protein